jgi:polyhydroxybutyrate depolymerase
MRISSVLVLALCLLSLSDCGALRRKAGKGKYSDHKITVSDTERSYIRYEPAGEPPELLLLLLHGGGGKASQVIRLARDLPELADSHHIRIIYPDGIGGHWNDGRGDISEAAKANVDDIGFMRAIAAEAGYPGKIRRVFAAGISNGGMMAQRIACDMPDVVSGVVTVAANLPVELEKKCQPAKPVSVMFIAGMLDPLVPYAGGPIKVFRKERGMVLSIEDSLAFWSRQLNCKSDPDEAMTASSFVRNYTCTRGGLKLIAVKNGGHAWPGGMAYLPEAIIGHTSEEFSASEKILEWLLGK